MVLGKGMRLPNPREFRHLKIALLQWRFPRLFLIIRNSEGKMLRGKEKLTIFRPLPVPGWFSGS